ncbi:MAG: DUF4955 domain-containing protein [Alistipes sp.]|nr:DUF4955 domain-containing protein [Alistipes sp.]
MKRILALALALCSLMIGCSNDLDGLRADVESLNKQLAALETDVAALNEQIIGVYALMNESTIIVGCTATSTGWRLELSDGQTIVVYDGARIEHAQPIYGIDAEGCWIVSLDGGSTFTQVLDASGAPASARPEESDDGETGAAGITPRVKIDAAGYWMVSLDGGASYEYLTDGDGRYVSAVSGSSYSGFFSEITYDEQTGLLTLETLTGQTVEIPVVADFALTIAHERETEPFMINERRVFPVEQTGVVEAMIQVPSGWSAQLEETSLAVTAPSGDSNGEIRIAILSDKKYMRIVSMRVSCSQGTPAWQAFITGSDENVLLDFSYAGYMHGETAPPDVSTLGYDVFNVCDYGAVPNDGLSDRKAFIAAVEAAKTKSGAIIYFPEGEFELHAATDDEKNYSEDIIITRGNFVLKGAGRDKTTILMSAPNIPADPTLMWSSNVLINLKHNSGLTDLTTVTGDSAKGTFSVEVASAAALKAGDWVCLTLVNNDPELILQELGSQQRYDNVNKSGYQIVTEGITIYDYHQIASISGTRVTFAEPLMHAVESKWGWKIQKYNHYENVGVEDITFKGNAKADFTHHGSWDDDGGYKPVNLMRMTNSWIRRVRFTDVSECSSIVNCANVSVYDIEITGNRGHAAIRSQGSSRVFIGKVADMTSGPLTSNPSTILEGVGQYHAVGVSKPSMGAVLWRNSWGRDSNFESHATQPRATLFDCCRGAFLTSRQGGDQNQMPNHLDDLTIWNFNETVPEPGNYISWWNFSSRYWKFMPPTIVGYAGQVQFDPESVKLDEGHGQNVYPESLYEAQLQQRLGSVPAWLLELK